ncbi:YfcE family phosphodiesterase [Streptomyces cyaneofuscatus]|uniref:YfcE family phosphodiesterase n=1 Tax=Streptomyces cyaneofuscatus TaxID=66883 RepID=UPI0037970A3D
MDADRSGAATGPSVRLLLVADTHLPLRARRHPDELLRTTERADVVVRAGDWVDVATLELLEGRARRLVGVYGNNDGPELRAGCLRWPARGWGAWCSASSTRRGRPRGREARCAALPPELDVLVFGHSHIPMTHRGSGRAAPAEPRLAHGPTRTARTTPA